LKSKIEAAINAKVSERRRELETELAKLAQFDGRGGKATRSGRGGAHNVSAGHLVGTPCEGLLKAED
jgi:hypothetical protein